jgi:hypothetical protein
VRAGGGVDELELAGAHVVDDEGAAGARALDAALLAEVAGGIEGEAQPEVAGAQRGRGQRQVATLVRAGSTTITRTCCGGAEVGASDLELAARVGAEVGEHGRRGGQEVEAA